MIETWIMDCGALFHATHSKEVLDTFELHSTKIHLAEDKTLDIARVRDVFPKLLFE